jgi:hypothetical protein
MKKRGFMVAAMVLTFAVTGMNLFTEEAIPDIKENPPSLTFYLGGTYLNVMGEFSNMVNYGYGLSGGIILHELFFPESAINLAGGFFNYDQAHEAIESFIQYKG